MSESDNGGAGFAGHQGLTDAGNERNRHYFLARQNQGRTRTAMDVKIMKVHGGGVGPAPTVDVMPLVKQVDGEDNATSHGMIYGIPVARNQAGSFTIINDPKVGDIGHMVISDRDSSSVRSSAKESTPGSRRMHDPADGVYHAAHSNQGMPTRYIQVDGKDGFNIVDEHGNKISTSDGAISITAKTLTLNGDLKVTGEVTAMSGGAGVKLSTHLHNGVQPGAGNTQKPVAGT